MVEKVLHGLEDIHEDGKSINASTLLESSKLPSVLKLTRFSMRLCRLTFPIKPLSEVILACETPTPPNTSSLSLASPTYSTTLRRHAAILPGACIYTEELSLHRDAGGLGCSTSLWASIRCGPRVYLVANFCLIIKHDHPVALLTPDVNGRCKENDHDLLRLYAHSGPA